eukprot:gene56930-biopygen118257
MLPLWPGKTLPPMLSPATKSPLAPGATHHPSHPPAAMTTMRVTNAQTCSPRVDACCGCRDGCVLDMLDQPGGGHCMIGDIACVHRTTYDVCGVDPPPTTTPSTAPSAMPTSAPTSPTWLPTFAPTPTEFPSIMPFSSPSSLPSLLPSASPTSRPLVGPTAMVAIRLSFGDVPFEDTGFCQALSATLSVSPATISIVSISRCVDAGIRGDDTVLCPDGSSGAACGKVVRNGLESSVSFVQTFHVVGVTVMSSFASNVAHTIPYCTLRPSMNVAAVGVTKHTVLAISSAPAPKDKSNAFAIAVVCALLILLLAVVMHFSRKRRRTHVVSGSNGPHGCVMKRNDVPRGSRNKTSKRARRGTYLSPRSLSAACASVSHSCHLGSVDPPERCPGPRDADRAATHLPAFAAFAVRRAPPARLARSREARAAFEVPEQARIRVAGKAWIE